MNGTRNYLDIKAELLCYGVRIGAEELAKMREQNPFFEKRGGLSSGGFFEFDDGLPVTAPVWENYVQYSPYELRFEDEWVLYKNQKRECSLIPLLPPGWYSKELSDGTPAPRLLQRHGRNQLASAIWSNCALFGKNEQCRFCLIGMNKKAIERKNPELLAEAVSIALEENRCYGLSLNGGMTYSKDRGSRNYLPVLRELEGIGGIPTGIEMAPPKERRYLEELYSAGADAVMMNLEAFDEGMRTLICPGKSRLCTREDYFRAWRDGVKIFGEGMVSSVLLIGLESVESTEAGINALVDMGVIPDLLVYRPMDNTQLRNFPRPSQTSVKYLYYTLGEKLKEAGLDANKQPGCAKCGGCSLTTSVCKAY